MKRAALYLRVSTVDQNPETQLLDLRRFAAQRGLQIVETYTDHGVNGTKAAGEWQKRHLRVMAAHPYIRTHSTSVTRAEEKSSDVIGGSLFEQMKIPRRW